MAARQPGGGAPPSQPWPTHDALGLVSASSGFLGFMTALMISENLVRGEGHAAREGGARHVPLTAEEQRRRCGRRQVWAHQKTLRLHVPRMMTVANIWYGTATHRSA